MFSGRCVQGFLFRVVLLFQLLALDFSSGKNDAAVKFGPFFPPHDKTIIEEFDRFAIHYCGLGGQAFSVAHCIFHGIVDTYSEKSLVYEDYEKVVELLLQRRNYSSPSKLLSSRGFCDNNVLQYTPIAKTKGHKSMKGVKLVTKADEFCKFSIRCFSSNQRTLLKDTTSEQQRYLDRWMGICSGSGSVLDALFASRMSRIIENLKLKTINEKELCQLGSRISLGKPEERVAICMKLVNSKDICGSVSPHAIGFKGWLSKAIDPLKKVEFRFDPKTMVDESVKAVVDIQLSEGIPPYCLPEEMFTYKPAGKKYVFLYNKLSLNEKLLIDQFLMHFVVNHGKIPRAVFDKRARFAVEGWMLHKNKFPIVSVHNSMYSIGRKIVSKRADEKIGSKSRDGEYPYSMPQFTVYGDYLDKPRSFVISDRNPLLTPCLQQGCAYFIGRSIDMSPVLMIRLQTVLSVKNKQLSASLFSMFIMSFAEKYLFYPGKVETIDFIIDCRGVSLTSIPTLLKLKPIFKYINDEGVINIYPLRVNKIFLLINGNTWFTLKDILSNFFLKETVDSVILVDTNNSKQDSKESSVFKILWKYMSPYMLEADIGGLRPCLKSGEFYPFKLLPGPYLPNNLKELKSAETPTLSHWSKPNFDSPKNLYELVPPEFFSSSGKTMDGNEVIFSVNWGETKLLRALPKEKWPDDANGTLGSSHMQEEESGKKVEIGDNTESTSSRDEEGEQSKEGGDLERGSDVPGIAVEEKQRQMQVEVEEREGEEREEEKVKEEGRKKEKVKEEGRKKEKEEEQQRQTEDREWRVMGKLRLSYSLLVNLKQMYMARLKKKRINYSLSEQCLRITEGHFSYFKKVVTETLEKLIGMRSREEEIGKRVVYYRRKKSLEEKQSMIEIYIEIMSALKLERVRGLFLNRLKEDFNMFEQKLSRAEKSLLDIQRDLDETVNKRRVGSSGNAIREELRNKINGATESITDIFNEFGEIKNLFNKIEPKIRNISKKMDQSCEDLLSKMNIITSFVQSQSSYDPINMLESSLLSNIVGSIVKEHKELVTLF